MTDIHGRLSPARLAPILGVSESTLKRWVDRGTLRAERTVGGHRRIAVSEALAFLRARGRPAPSLEAVGLLAGSTPPGEAMTPEALAGLLLAGDVGVARRLLVGSFQAGVALDDLLERLAAPAMARIGAGWAEGAIDVYQEHLATQRLWQLLLELRALLPAPDERAPLALGGAPEDDPYVLPTLMAELALLDLGWRTLNLGPDVPLGALRAAVAAHAPRLVWISVTSAEPAPPFFAGFPAFFEAARAAGAAVIVGGQGLTLELQDRLVASALGRRLRQLRAFARALR